MKTLKTLKAELLADPDVRQAYDDLALEYEIARAIVRARSPQARRRLSWPSGWAPPSRTWRSWKAARPSGNEHSGQGREATGTRPRWIWSKPSLDYPRRSGMLRERRPGRLGLRKNPTSRKIPHLRPHGAAVLGISLGAESYSLAPEHTWGCREISFLYALVQEPSCPRVGLPAKFVVPATDYHLRARGRWMLPEELRKRRRQEQAHERERREQSE